MSDEIYRFQARWKEEMLCTCSLGSLILDMPMGVVSVYLPTRSKWEATAPAWAREQWRSVHEQLSQWCSRNTTPLHIEENAQVWEPR